MITELKLLVKISKTNRLINHPLQKEIDTYLDSVLPDNWKKKSEDKLFKENDVE